MSWVKSLSPTLLDHNPLDLVERDLIAGVILELRRARTFVRRHRLSILQSAAVFKAGGDSCRPKRVTTNLASSPASRARRRIIDRRRRDSLRFRST
jgi:hypothetical protein